MAVIRTVAVPGQSDIVAEGAGDTLTVVGNNGIVVSTTASTDTLLITTSFGNVAGTICQGDDGRLSNSRTPLQHAASHGYGATDPLKLDALAPPDDTTTLNANTSTHGLLRKLSGNASDVLLGNGTWGLTGSASTLSAGIVSVKEYGAAGDSTGVGSTGTDDTTAFQSAINSCITSGKALFIPPGTYRITAQINVTGKILIFGVGNSPYINSSGGNHGTGSWVYITHTGIGFSVTNLPATISGVVLRDFGIIRPQPAAAAGWAPTDHSYDISVGGADIFIQNFMCWSSTRGVYLYQDGASAYGRATIDNLRGHFFKVGIFIKDQYDLPRFSNIHMWPFYWDSYDYIHSYTRANLWGIYAERSDGLQLHNFFVIMAFAGLVYGKNSYGQGTHLRGQYTNIYCDLCTSGILIDTAITSNFSFQCSNLVTSCPWPNVGVGMRIRGSNCRIDISNWEVCFAAGNAIQVEGTGNILTINGLRVTGYNWSEIAAAAIKCDTGNNVWLGSFPVIEDGHGGATKSGAGTVVMPASVTL